MNNKVVVTLLSITNYLKCKWIKSSNQKIQGGWMYRRTRPLHMLPTRGSLQMEKHTQTESKGMEKDISLNESKQTNKS